MSAHVDGSVYARTAAAGRFADGTPARYWSGARVVVLAMIGIIAVRLHELVPRLGVLQPALLAMALGTATLVFTADGRVLHRAFAHQIPRLALAYFGFMAVTAPFALWPGGAVTALKQVLPGIVLLVAILFCAPTRRNLLYLQVGLVIFASLYALYAKLYGRIFADGRLEAGLGMYDSNDMAALLALVFPLAVGAARVSRGWLRYGMAAAAVLLLVVNIASGSRGGALALGTAAVLLVLGTKGWKRTAALMLLIAAVATIWSTSPSFRQRMNSLTQLENDYNTKDEFGRKAVWTRGLGYFNDHPLIGVGVGNFDVAEGEYFRALYGGSRGAKWSNAHNAYVQAFVELGLLGGSIFLALLLTGLRRSWRLWRGVRLRDGGVLHQPELFASLGGAAVAAIFLSHAYFLPLFTLLGLVALADTAAPRATARSASRRSAALVARPSPAARGAR